MIGLQKAVIEKGFNHTHRFLPMQCQGDVNKLHNDTRWGGGGEGGGGKGVF